MTKTKKKWLVLLFVIVGFVAICELFMAYFEGQGQAFFDRGKAIRTSLRTLAAGMSSGNPDAMNRALSAQYTGKRLGLVNLKTVEERDGVIKRQFISSDETINRDAALEEWHSYLSGFSSIEEVGLHIHRMESWDNPEELKASVRFELIGSTPGAAHAGIDRAYFQMTFVPGGDGYQIREASLIEGERVSSDSLQFVNVASEAGVDFENQYYPRFLTDELKFKMIRYGPGGITATDYNNDGYYDLFIPDGVNSRLFRNRKDGFFEDVTDSAGLGGQDGVSVAVFADYDNDGHRDVFISRTFTPNQLFRNNGDGTFTNVTEKSGIGADYCATVASWADYDNDGFLDLYVGRYLDPRKDIPTTFYARNGEPNQLYRNNGDGTFINVTEKAGVGEIGLCLGTVWGDYDDDGYPDLYVVNDFGRNTLYHNNGDGTFTDVTVASGTLAYGAGMNASMGDYDNDGKIDIYVTNIRSEEAWYAEWPTVMRYMVNSWKQGVWRTDMPLYMEIFRQSGFQFVEVFQQMASGNNLLRNRGDGTFEDVSWQTGANPPGWFWGASLSDFDNDGWVDIYAANGWVYNDRGTEIELDFLNSVVSRQDVYKSGLLFDPEYFGKESWHGWERNRYMRSNRDGTFSEIGRAAGNDLITNSRGVAVADFWNRGVLDISVAASTDRHALLKNQIGARRRWLAVELVGRESNRDAVGARITVRIGDARQTREIVLGDGYGSQSSLRQYFGLDEATAVDELTVRWPRTGKIQTFSNVAGDRIVEITEGQDVLIEKSYAP